MVELEAQPQQQPALEDARRQVRVARLAAHGAEEDRVVLTDLLEHGVGQHLTGREVALGAEVVAGGLELHPGQEARLLEHLERLGGDLGADPVTRDDGELQRTWKAVESGMRSMLVVVRSLAAVVPQVERGLHGLGALRALGVVLGRTPLGVHLVHGAVSSMKSM